MIPDTSRRQWLEGVTASVITGVAATPLLAQEQPPAGERDPFRYSLNTSTIRGQNLTIVEEVGIAARAGYQAIEPWINELERHVQGGGTLRDLRNRIRDAGLRVESSIGFAEWIVEDDARRRQGLERARRDMDMVHQIGGTRIAAPPAGATNQNNLSLDRIAERYRTLLEIGERIGVTPQLEVWGFSQTLTKLADCAYVTTQCGHARACIMADVYHLYKGGSPFAGLKQLNGGAMAVFHMNDYPARPPRAQITDADRIYPGDGVAPLAEVIRTLYASGYRGVLSLELFNRDYYRQEALTVARTGLEKMRRAVRGALRN